MEPKSVWRKLHTIEQSERELIGEAKEERQIMSGSFIKDKYEKPVSIRRKRQRPMDSPVIGEFVFFVFFLNKSKFRSKTSTRRRSND